MRYSCKEAIKDHEALGCHSSEAGKSLDGKATKNIFVKAGKCVYICVITDKAQEEQVRCHSSPVNSAIPKHAFPRASLREG